jgi:hypothetical protein
MIHYRAGTRNTRNQTLKRYVMAVAIGLLLGSVYAVAGPIHESLAQASLPMPAPPHMAQSLRSRNSCTANPVAVPLAEPAYTSAHTVEWNETPIGGPVCTWAI